MRYITAIPMLCLQLFFGTIMLVRATYQKIKAKLTGKPYDSNMDM